ncbi:hypothetical protein OS128_06660 [Corynebacterium sp. P5848]|uniref:hypothetical protein n=1 Tax=Corynebacterium marambiense TaxID=2765364 RepID=UPI002260E6DC|nr:hypothetical protein [Corynebacterium marambiense]MCX7542593.1 hypothetical protein [Corynebacterium marambiense]
MSIYAMQWSPTAAVSMHEWGVLVYSEHGAKQIKGTGLDAPVSWLQSRLESPVSFNELARSLSPAGRTRMRGLLEALIACGAVTVGRANPGAPETITLRLSVDGNPSAVALADQLISRVRALGARCIIDRKRENTGTVCIDGTLQRRSGRGEIKSFRLVITDRELWLGIFAGSEARRQTAAKDLVRQLLRSRVFELSDLGGMPWEAWVPWLSLTLVNVFVEGANQDRCVRLGWDPYSLEEHRLVIEDSESVGCVDLWPVESKERGDDLGDPLVISRRCATLVDDSTSPLGVPSESGLVQDPLQISRCQVRLAEDAVLAVPGYGWTLEEARGMAVGAAVLEHSISCLAPEFTGYEFREHGIGSNGSFCLLRKDVFSLISQDRGIAALGPTDVESVHRAAVRLAARLVLEKGLVSWLGPVPLPDRIYGADLLALHKGRTELLMAANLPFALAAVSVAPEIVVVGTSIYSDDEAVREAVVQALLHHQCQEPSNQFAVPRTWSLTLSDRTTQHPRCYPNLRTLFDEYGLPVVVPLSSGPDLDAALPHRSLVLLVPEGADL